MTQRVWVAVDPNPNERWRSRAACRPAMGHDPEVWFPAPANPWATREEQELAQRRRKANEDRAKAICKVCPVRPECLADAIANDERDGIWGGQTPHERGVQPMR